MIIHYIIEKNIFVVIVDMLSVQKKILNCHIKNCFKINGKQRIIMPEKVITLISKIIKKK